MLAPTLRLFQAAYVLEQKEVDETLGSKAVNSRICLVLVTTLQKAVGKTRERMTGKCYGWVLLVGVRAEVRYQGVL